MPLRHIRNSPQGLNFVAKKIVRRPSGHGVPQGCGTSEAEGKRNPPAGAG